MNLAPGTALERYAIVRPVGQGGFGITYLAEHARLHTTVIIKEFFPNQLVWRSQDGIHVEARPEFTDEARHFLDSFEKEAQLLATFSHQNIVRVTDVFEANDTAYIVMAYEQGETLEDAFRSGKHRDEQSLTALLGPLLDALSVLHAKGVIHRDIKGDNIIVREDGSPVLIDFGSARVAHGVATQTVTALVTPGYAPIEQFDADSARLGPWTDIYALGATLYRAVAGKPPTRAFERSSTIADQRPDPFTALVLDAHPGYTAPFLSAINASLAFSPQNRPQTTEQWRAQLEAGGATADADADTVLAAGMVPGASAAAPAPGRVPAPAAAGTDQEADTELPAVPASARRTPAPAPAAEDLPVAAASSPTPQPTPQPEAIPSDPGQSGNGGRTARLVGAALAVAGALGIGMWLWRADLLPAGDGGRAQPVVVAAGDPAAPRSRDSQTGATAATSAAPATTGAATAGAAAVASASPGPPRVPLTVSPSVPEPPAPAVAARPSPPPLPAIAAPPQTAPPDTTTASARPSGSSVAADAAELRALLGRWTSAWEQNTRSVEAYASFYAPGFAAKGMDRQAWVDDKRDKGQRAECIDVGVAAPRITLSGERAVVEFVQTYRSHRYCDVGSKTMVLERISGRWQVVSEEQPTYERCNEFCTPRS